MFPDAKLICFFGEMPYPDKKLDVLRFTLDEGYAGGWTHAEFAEGQGAQSSLSFEAGNAGAG